MGAGGGVPAAEGPAGNAPQAGEENGPAPANYSVDGGGNADSVS